uniref:Uncharacterized protein n=1 Tax=Physcomitrium patens TaxID=3218 RepID=A0A2K1KMF7_PHYPA|nr:hypothetical protein PHYPA_005858 [Physcomitrium patens]
MDAKKFMKILEKNLLLSIKESDIFEEMLNTTGWVTFYLH